MLAVRMKILIASIGADLLAEPLDTFGRAEFEMVGRENVEKRRNLLFILFP